MTTHLIINLVYMAMLACLFITLMLIAAEVPQKLARKYAKWYIANGWKLCQHKGKGVLVKCWPHIHKRQVKCKNCPWARGYADVLPMPKWLQEDNDEQ